MGTGVAPSLWERLLLSATGDKLLTKTARPWFLQGLGSLIGRRPTLPRSCPRSTIGAEGLNGRVRDGNGCGPLAMATRNFLAGVHSADPRGFGPASSVRSCRDVVGILPLETRVKKWVQSPIFVAYPVLETRQLGKRKSLTVPIFLAGVRSADPRHFGPASPNALHLTFLPSQRPAGGNLLSRLSSAAPPAFSCAPAGALPSLYQSTHGSAYGSTVGYCATPLRGWTGLN